MIFNSLQYFVFFPVVILVYFSLPHRWRWAWLLAASIFFYMSFVPIYILILGGAIVIDYFMGIRIEGSSGVSRKMWLVASMTANVGVLATFKYFDFLNDSLGSAFQAVGLHYPVMHLGILLPIGLSFHTFQAMSYTIEVYRARQAAEKHFGFFALYVMFFPQLVAGPIERPQNLLHQLKERHFFEYERIAGGLRLIAGGLIKKIAIADRLALYVAPVYANPEGYTGAPLITATVFFAFQIYCDFSAYSDIAIGSAQVLGVRLLQNFRNPYSSRSVPEFWTRWHISLSTWFRDYIYLPLGGNRVPAPLWLRNILVTFVLSGLWHGANWTFIAWGALNGLFVVIGRATADVRARLRNATGLARVPFLEGKLRVVTTFALICSAWVLFRAESMSDAAFIYTHMFSNLRGSRVALPTFGYNAVVTSFLLIAGLLVAEHMGNRVPIRDRVAKLGPAYRWSLYYAACMLIIMFGMFDRSSPFIYFRF